MSEFSTKTLRVIQSSEAKDEPIEIDSDDYSGCVEVRVKKGKETVQSMLLPPAQAKLVAEAIIQCAKELELNQAL